MMHKKKVITTGVKRRRRVESPAPGEFEGGDATRGPSEGVYDDGLPDGESNDYGSEKDDCMEGHDSAHDRAHDAELDEMLTEVLSSLMVDERDGLQRAVERSSLGGCLNVFPSWDALDQAAVDLARNGPVPPVDLVATGQFTREEAALTAWGQLYKIQLAAMNALQKLITELDGNGAYMFYPHNLRKEEQVRRRVLQENIPPHQCTARGALYTTDQMEAAVMRKNPVIDARHIIAIGVQNVDMLLVL
jgi:hypothetical protein